MRDATAPDSTRRRPLLPVAVGLVVALAAGGLAGLRWVPAGAVALIDSPLREERVLAPGIHGSVPLVESVTVLDPLRRQGALRYATPEGASFDLVLRFALRLRPETARRLVAEGEGGRAEERLREALDRRVLLRLRDAGAGSLPHLDDALAQAVATDLSRFGELDGPVEIALDPSSASAAALRRGAAERALRKLDRRTGVRILLVGLDGVDWQIAEPMIERGELPVLARLRREGAWGHVKALMPMLSPLLWTSVATGTTPDRHGIVDFLVSDPRTGEESPVDSRQRRRRALWNLYTETGRTVDVVGWWATWPAETVNGHVVSDRVAYSLFDVAGPGAGARLTWPPELLERLRPRLVAPDAVTHDEVARFVAIDGPELERIRGAAADEAREGYRDPVSHLTRMLAATRSYHAAALDLLRRGPADLTAVYYQLVDEVCHRFMHFAPPRLQGIAPADVRRFGSAVEAAYRHQDRLLGELIEVAGPDTTVIALSDHGFVSGPDRPVGETADVEGKPGRWHRRYGIAVLAGPPIRPGRLEPLSLLDIAPTVLYLAGLPVAEDMDGRVLVEAIDPTFRQRFPETRVATYELAPLERAAPPDDEATAAGEAELIENLRSLGYVGGGAGAAAQAGASGDLTSHVNLAAVLLSSGQLDRAEEEILAALALDPRYPAARLQLFHLRYRQRRFDEAIGIADPLLAGSDAADGLFLMRAARAYSESGRLDEGLRRVRELVRGGAWRAGVTLAYLLLDSGDRPGADHEARAVLRRDPLDEAAMDVVFKIAAGEGRSGDVVPLLEEALRANPRSVVHLNWLSFVDESRGDPAAAERLLRRALEIEPDDAASLANLGRVVLRLGRPDAAVELLGRSLRASPSNHKARLDLAAALRATGRPAEALAEYDRVAREAPATPALCNAAAEAADASGDLAAARAWLRRSLDLDPAQPEARERLARLESPR